MKTPVIPSPIGFKAGGIHCGIKKRHKDLALIYSQVPAAAAGMLTTNQAKAAPVKITKEVIADGAVQAIIVNSGNANACTGVQGERDALEMARATAEKLNIDISKVAVASTGHIGKLLPIRKIINGIEKLSSRLSPNQFLGVAQAIMTTDTHPKYISRQINLGGKIITITAVAKGAGMIYPHMATMLCFICTDLNIAPPLLSGIVTNSVSRSFNCISVDACTSTNDMVLAMANGMAENPRIDSPGNELNIVQEEFNHITIELAQMIVADAEGATKLIQVEVTGCHSFDGARRIAFSVANFNLLKCTFFGASINWGRIMAAIGSAPVRLDPAQIDVYLHEKQIIKNGNLTTGIPLPEISALLKQRNITVKIDLHQGSHGATVWTCDLSPKYIKINMQ